MSEISAISGDYAGYVGIEEEVPLSEAFEEISAHLREGGHSWQEVSGHLLFHPLTSCTDRGEGGEWGLSRASIPHGKVF